ncbi:MAG: rRNA pseudouridine synthase [Bdellovibrionales bacterium]|nr:rRNA pseudouridine synthase [Oligoflexia bacterium]
MKKTQKGRVSLERALSKLGLASRAEALALIESGQVKVHGQIETSALRMVNPDTAHIELKGQKAAKSETQLLRFHKPRAVLTTKRDPEGRATIYDCLPAEFQNFHAVGRLDMHTTGLLLLTNDTKLSSYLTDPKNQIPRIYIVKVRGELSEESVIKMTEGLQEGDDFLQASSAKLLKSSRRESTLELCLKEGKNREIRRLCEILGHEVTALKRISFGSILLGELKPGAFQLLSFNELNLIIKGA